MMMRKYKVNVTGTYIPDDIADEVEDMVIKSSNYASAIHKAMMKVESLLSQEKIRDKVGREYEVTVERIE